MRPKILGADQIRPVLKFERLIPALHQGYRDFFAGRSVVAPITNIAIPEANGEMHIKPGHMTDGDFICVKIVTCFYDNPSAGLPTRDGALVLANKENGRIEAVLCDSGLITDMRTAGSSAVAVDALARPGAVTVGLIGAGTQAYWHAEALRHVRNLNRIVVWGRNSQRSRAAARRISESTGIEAVPGALEEAAACDVVVCATPATSPILDKQILRPGSVVVAMGADAVGKRELGPDILMQAELVVADSLSQCRQYGELQWPLDKERLPRIAELGAILSGSTVGRASADDIIIFDSTGVAFQDVIGASEVLQCLGETVSFAV